MKKIITALVLSLLSFASPAVAEGEYEPLLAADNVTIESIEWDDRAYWVGLGECYNGCWLATVNQVIDGVMTQRTLWITTAVKDLIVLQFPNWAMDGSLGHTLGTMNLTDDCDNDDDDDGTEEAHDQDCWDGVVFL